MCGGKEYLEVNSRKRSCLGAESKAFVRSTDSNYSSWLPVGALGLLERQASIRLGTKKVESAVPRDLR